MATELMTDLTAAATKARLLFKDVARLSVRTATALSFSVGCESAPTSSSTQPPLAYGGEACTLDSQCANQMRCIEGTCQLCPDGESAIFQGAAFTCGPPCAVDSLQCDGGNVCAPLENFPDSGVCVSETWLDSVSQPASGASSGSCSNQCDLQCSTSPPQQACLYCQAACLCKCSGEQGCFESSCAMVNSLNASGGENWCPDICP